MQNAIGWANVRLRGTWKAYGMTIGGYAALVAAGFAYFAHLSGAVGAGTMAACCTILFFLQMLLLIFGGCTAVGNAVRRDMTTGLIASHRLMPVSPAAAILGYLFGPTLQVLTMAAINVLFGIAAATMAGLEVQAWLASNIAIVLFVVFLWVFVAFAGFMTKNACGGLFGLLFSSIFGGGALVIYVPAMAVLLAPLIFTFTSAMGRGGGIAKFSIGFGYAMAAQFVFGAILFRGAMRRYRRDDVPALGTRLSFLLLGAWIVTSAIGVLRWTDFSINPRMSSIDVRAQAIAATITSMIVALVSVSASAKASTEWTRSTLTTGFPPGPRPLPPPALAALAAALIFALALGLRPQYSSRYPELIDPGFSQIASPASILFAVRIAAIAGLYLLSISYLLRIVYRVAGKPFLMIGIWTVLIWLIPIGLESARRVTMTRDDKPFFSRMSAVGELSEIWSHPNRTSILGLVVQLLVAGVPAVMFYMTEPKRVSAKLVPAIT